MFTNMSCLTVIPYTPKVPKNSITRVPAKSQRPDLREEPVKTVPISTKVVGNNDWQQKPTRDSEDTAQEDPTRDTEKVQGM